MLSSKAMGPSRLRRVSGQQRRGREQKPGAKQCYIAIAALSPGALLPRAVRVVEKERLILADSDISFAEVAASADRLTSEGLPVTVAALRGAHPGASLPSIHAHLSAWRSSQAQPLQEPEATVPEAVLAGLKDWAQQFAEERVAALRSGQQHADGDLASVLQMGEEMEAELKKLRVQLEEREASIRQLTVEVRHARDLASDALVGKAKDRLAIDGKDEQIAKLRQQLESGMAASAAASDARLAAEMELVGATTARDRFAAEITDLRAQLDAARLGRHA